MCACAHACVCSRQPWPKTFSGRLSGDAEDQKTVWIQITKALESQPAFYFERKERQESKDAPIMRRRPDCHLSTYFHDFLSFLSFLFFFRNTEQNICRTKI